MSTFALHTNPIQVSIFCEGTRFTEDKYQVAVNYAKERGLPVLKHHLVPRTKGFAVLAHYLKTKGNGEEGREGGMEGWRDGGMKEGWREGRGEEEREGWRGGEKEGGREGGREREGGRKMN